jgi:succinate dehydrogenase / fumarate reductase flavoprotein subunit
MYTQEMLESIKKLEASREARMANEPRRMTADEKSALLKAYHPDYREDGFVEIKVCI